MSRLTTIAAVLALAAPALGADRAWTNDAGGSFQDPANWDGPVPGPDDTAVFGLNGIYTIDFAAAALTDRTRVENASITFALNAEAYELLSASGIAPGVTVTSGPGGLASLRVTGGGLRTVFAEVASPAGDLATLSAIGAGGLVEVIDRLLIGGAGIGVGGVEDGGEILAGRTVIGESAGAVGNVSVRDAGSRWSVADDLVVARRGGGGLVVSDGGLLESGRAIIGQLLGSNGGVTVTGPGSTWMNDGPLDVGQNGMGQLEVLAGGQVHNAGFATLGTFATGAFPPVGGGQGTAIVSGDGSALTIDGELRVGLFFEGDLRIENGGHVSCASGTLAWPPVAGAGGFVPSTLHVTGMHSALAVDGTIFIASAAEVTQGGTIVAALVDVRDANFDGVLSGDGVIDGALQVTDGTVSPGIDVDPLAGAPVATLGVTGDATLLAEGRLLVDVEPPSGADRLDVAGVAALGGTLEVRLVGDPAGLEPGDGFVVLTADAVTGVFDDFAPDPLPDEEWFLRYEPNQVVIGVALAADVNRDGLVDVNDMVQVIVDWGPCPAPEEPCPSDTNGDGVVDGADLDRVLTDWT